ncbi:response regulator [Paracidovorax citrulli]|uniref:Response regulator receiver protein n=2 Tax=Paracidovorax citrulli TaxID=80869 RepID=A1TRG0_PARC0|nr:response regulator [Paracidovorax citrulli]ABM33548.1 response regulator receiver protein [Paracidovorax citrulli AAC00-1]ATG94160.1 response regulator [Paracidovorax citrulli]MVT38889.1 response regulator [Paracidovorax citrulli]PVY62974.1 response regulator receiver domain-containing protein [Paracidovorax citrulli]QCX12727.1 Transcriptional regulatory protein ZraR [Paracidovorax citrulli]
MHADILIVDDNHEAAELLRDLLELNGHSVRVALDGAQAIALMRAQPALLLLVDQRLPDMLGAELVPQLKGIALAAGLPGCIAIGITGLNAAERASLGGFDHVLGKPLNFGTFDALVERSLASLRQPRGA